MGSFCCTGSEGAMKAIERRVCGCDFGGNSWTTREQGEAMIPLLGLGSTSTLLDLGAGTGWTVIERYDLTSAYRDCCAQQIDTDCEYRTELAELLDAQEAKARLSNWRSKLKTIKEGLFVREMFVCKAQGAGPAGIKQAANGHGPSTVSQ